MKLLFAGTRGEIEARTARHRMHTSLVVSYRRRRVMIDAGADWRGELDRVRPHAIVVTHAHPDHAWGLDQGAPCPVWAPARAWDGMADYPIREAEQRVLEHRAPAAVEGMTFEAFPVEHSIRAPAVGYRVTAGRVTVFYAPDVVYVPDREEALRGARAYIGDGASLKRSFVRKRGERLIGHAPVYTQLGWCAREGVPLAVITHCGKEIVEGDEAAVVERLEAWGRERGVEVELAHDGLEIVLR